MPPWVTSDDAPVVIAVIWAGLDATGRQVARQARSLCGAGADGVEIVPVPGVDPALARCSPAELVAAVAEEHLPVGLTVTSMVAAHLAVGAGAAWLRVEAASLDHELADALASMGRPCIVKGLPIAARQADDTPSARALRLQARPEVSQWDTANLVVELPLESLAGMVQIPQPMADTDPPRPVFAVDLTTGAYQDAGPTAAADAVDEARRGWNAAGVSLAAQAGAAIVFTDLPADARRAVRVTKAVREAY